MSTRPEPNNPPEIRGTLTRSVIERRNDYVQARARYCTMLDWEREDLVKNMGDLLGQCERDVQERMLWHFLLIHDDLGTRVGKAIRLSAADVRHLEPLPGQVLTAEDQARLKKLGSNGDSDRRGEMGQVDRVGRQRARDRRAGAWRHAGSARGGEVVRVRNRGPRSDGVSLRGPSVYFCAASSAVMSDANVLAVGGHAT